MTKGSKPQPKLSKGRTPARSAPLSRGGKSANRSPSITRSGNKITVRHCEYVKDVESDLFNEFSYEVFALSPGQSQTFPWLASIAGSYESFVFKKLNAVYKPNCSATTGGKVIFATDYDATDATDNETKSTLLQWEGSVDTQCWEPMTMVMSHANLTRVGPTRFIEPPQSGSLDRLTSAGNLYVATTAISGVMPTATVGQFTVSTLGELWLDYEVELITPALIPGFNAGNPVIADPQFATTLVGIGNFDLTGNNVLRGFASTTTPGTPPPVIVNPNHAGIELVQMKAGTLVDVANQPTLTDERVLRFDKDFVGDMVISYQTPAGYQSGSAPIPAVTPLRATQPADYPAGSSLWGLINSYIDVPSLVSTIASTVQSSGASTVMSSILKLAVQKGTYLLVRDLGLVPFTWNTNGGNRANLRLTSRKYDAGDLLSGPSAIMLGGEPAPAGRRSGALRARARTSPFFERLDRYRKSLAADTPKAESATGCTSVGGVKFVEMK